MSANGAAHSAQRYSIWFVLVVAVFVTTLITANIIAVKLLALGPFVIDAGTIVFPVSYIVGDVLTEVYGFRRARRVIWLGFLCNLLAVTAIVIGGALPAADFWQDQAAYDTILGYSPRLLVASFVAYLFGEFSNSYVLARLKVITKGRWLWTRTISSTIVGQGIDSVIFMIIAFAGTMSSGDLLTTIVTLWLFKVAYEALATPLTYLVVNHIKKQEGVDVYDTDISFNPLSLAE
jgi:uncharacterized integral membrane protein (TIGR00697 family)